MKKIAAIFLFFSVSCLSQSISPKPGKKNLVSFLSSCTQKDLTKYLKTNFKKGITELGISTNNFYSAQHTPNSIRDTTDLLTFFVSKDSSLFYRKRWLFIDGVEKEIDYFKNNESISEEKYKLEINGVRELSKVRK